LGQFFRNLQGQLGGHQQNAKFDRLRNVEHAPVAGQADYRLLTRIDRKYLSFVAHGNHVPEGGISGLLRVRGCADHGDAFRPEKCTQR